MIKSKHNKKSIKENDLELKSFTIHEKRRDSADFILYELKSYLHWENMLLILINQAHKDKKYDIVKILTNKMVMKAVSQGKTGKQTKGDVEYLLKYYRDSEIFSDLVKHSSENLNGHNCSMIVERVKAQRAEIKKRRDLFFQDRSAYLFKYKTDGEPQYQKQKALAKANNYSVPLEADKWSLVKNKLGLTFGKKQIKRFVNMNAEYLLDKEIKSVGVSTSHGHIYYNFAYLKSKKTEERKITKKIKRPRVEAGLDVGVNNLMSVVINDDDSKSLIFDGKLLKRYNSKSNRKLAKLMKTKSEEVVEYIERENEKGEKYTVPAKYSERGVKTNRIISNLFEKRNRYFQDQLNKISLKLLQLLKKSNVTDLVISKNLSFAKKDGTIKMGKSSKQKFYQIPFGRLLNLIEAKAIEFNITVHNVNEAYTSKTSCLSSDVNLIQKKNKSDEKITHNDLNGSRGVNNKRGLYKDTVLNKIINADLNGAANHIKLCFKDVDLSVYWKKLWKLCNPIKIKSASDFDRLLSNNETKRKITCDNGLFKSDDQVCLV